MGGETSWGNDIDLFFGDLVENLDFGFMGVCHVFHDKWHASMDVLYMDLSADNGKDIALPNDRTLSGLMPMSSTSGLKLPLLSPSYSKEMACSELFWLNKSISWLLWHVVQSASLNPAFQARTPLAD